jgi:hypothetical protein
LRSRANATIGRRASRRNISSISLSRSSKAYDSWIPAICRQFRHHADLNRRKERRCLSRVSRPA